MKKLPATVLLVASLATATHAENAYTDRLVKIGMIDTYILKLGYPAEGEADPCKLGKLKEIQEALHVLARGLRDYRMSGYEWYSDQNIGAAITDSTIQQDLVNAEFCKLLREHSTDLGVLK